MPPLTGEVWYKNMRTEHNYAHIQTGPSTHETQLQVKISDVSCRSSVGVGVKQGRIQPASLVVVRSGWVGN